MPDAVVECGCGYNIHSHAPAIASLTVLRKASVSKK